MALAALGDGGGALDLEHGQGDLAHAAVAVETGRLAKRLAGGTGAIAARCLQGPEHAIESLDGDAVSSGDDQQRLPVGRPHVQSLDETFTEVVFACFGADVLAAYERELGGTGGAD